MPCTLTSSLALDCRDGVGGILEIKVKTHPGTAVIASDFTESSGVISIAAGSSRQTWYTYNLEKETASLTEKTTVSVANGTVFSEQELKIIFNKLSAKLRNEIKLLAQNRLIFAVRDLNSVYWLVGMDYGADLVETNATTGTARGDRSGYELTFKAKEKSQLLNISAATYDTLITA